MAIRSVEYLQSLVRELAKLPDETEWVEFKCNNKQPQMIGEYISALSNSAALCERPKAYLVWGVDDATHKIVGTEFQYRKMKKGNEELEAWLSRMLSPRINFRFFEVPMDEGMVVLMEIPCAEKQPVQFAGGEYIRIGTNKKNLKEYPDKERELWRTFDSTPYELRIAMGNLNAPRIENQNNQFTKAILFAKVPFELTTKEDRMRTCYMQACLAYVNFEGISNSDIRKIFGLGEKEKAKASRLLTSAVEGGYIKVMDPDTAPRYKKYIPYWA